HRGRPAVAASRHHHSDRTTDSGDAAGSSDSDDVDSTDIPIRYPGPSVGIVRDMARNIDAQTDARGFFGHPRGLATLFGIEIWERFSFYGMQAILTYYLYFSVTDGGLQLPQASATSL